MNREKIKSIALENGFRTKALANGEEDLHPYVYHFAEALIAERRIEITPEHLAAACELGHADYPDGTLSEERLVSIMQIPLK